ncbi:MAG: ferrochelatase [Acidobacteriota bacterium]
MTEPYDSVLLLGFGGPNRPEEIRPYLENVLRGRPVPPERFDEVAANYMAVGGRSPYNDLTFRQAQGLRRLLEAEGKALPVYVGMRNWNPLIAETLQEMVRNERQRAIGIILAPHQGEASWGRYFAALKQAEQETHRKVGDVLPRIDFCDPWFDHPLFIEAVSDKVRCKRDKVPYDQRSNLKTLFTAHSVPTPLCQPYLDQLRRSCGLVAEEVGIEDWELVFQSRSGRPSDPWLEPDVCDAIRRVSSEGFRNVFLIPISFICDHVEVQFDLDLKARQEAEALGMGFFRACTVNDHPSFLRMLLDVVRRTQQVSVPV